MTTFGEALQALMRDRDMSLRRTARESNTDKGYLTRITQDRQRPSVKIAEALERTLDAPGALTPLIPPRKQRGPVQAAPNGASVGTVVDGSTVDRLDDDVKRRAALQMITAIGAGAALPAGALETVLAGIEDALGGPVDLDEWEGAVHDYGRQLIIRPSGALVEGLTADIIAISEILKRQHTPQDRAGLLRISAGLSAALAIDLGDVGDIRGSRISWGTAKRAADASGDTDLRVWVRGRSAQDTYWMTRSTRHLSALTDEAIAIANGTPSAGLARAHAARAYRAADQGDSTRANESIAAMKRTFEHLPNDPNDQSVLAFRESQLRWAESYAYTSVGDKRAQESLSKALSLYPPDATGPRVNLALIRAAGLVRERDINAGLDHALTTITNSSGFGTAGQVFITGQILRTLPDRAHALPVARELRAVTSGV